jgi:hypothetical protein
LVLAQCIDGLEISDFLPDVREVVSSARCKDKSALFVGQNITCEYQCVFHLGQA